MNEDESLHLEPEEAEEIIGWAIRASALITLMEHAPDHKTIDEAYERLEGYIEAISMLYDTIPEAISDMAHEMASDSIEETERQEAEIEKFRKEIEDL